MSAATQVELQVLADKAGHIAALAEMVATALMIDPATSIAGEAAEGLAVIARQLCSRLCSLADPEA